MVRGINQRKNRRIGVRTIRLKVGGTRDLRWLYCLPVPFALLSNAEGGLVMYIAEIGAPAVLAATRPPEAFRNGLWKGIAERIEPWKDGLVAL